MVKLRKYGWLIKLISAALLLAIGFYLRLSNQGETIVNIFVGSAIILFAIVRLIPITKTEKDDIFKMVNTIEITVNFLVGVMLIVFAVIELDIGALFGYILGGILFARGAIHFYGISANLEDSDFATYISNILFIAIGTFIITTGDITASTLIWIILGISVLGGGYLVYDGGKGYKAYRYQKVNAKELKDVTLDDKKPTIEDPKPIIKEDIIEDEKRDRPSVN